MWADLIAGRLDRDYLISTAQAFARAPTEALGEMCVAAGNPKRARFGCEVLLPRLHRIGIRAARPDPWNNVVVQQGGIRSGGPPTEVRILPWEPDSQAPVAATPTRFPTSCKRWCRTSAKRRGRYRPTTWTARPGPLCNRRKSRQARRSRSDQDTLATTPGSTAGPRLRNEDVRRLVSTPRESPRSSTGRPPCPPPRRTLWPPSSLRWELWKRPRWRVYV
jgi:hypothetical protein